LRGRNSNLTTRLHLIHGYLEPQDDQEEEERRWRIEQHQQRQSALPAATAAAAARGGRGAPRGAARGGRGGASATPSPTAGASSSPTAGAGTGAPRGGARGGARGGGAASASLTPPAGSSTPPAARPVSGIGGFHAVDVPFDDSARSVLAQYESGSANFVEFVRTPLLPLPSERTNQATHSRRLQSRKSTMARIKFSVSRHRRLRVPPCRR